MNRTSQRCAERGRRSRSFRPTVERLEQRLVPATLLPGFTESAVVSSVASGTAMEFSPTGELWVLEQTGQVKLVRSDATTHTALTLGVDSSGERGLLGIAFPPTYDGAGGNTDFVYLYHTLASGANNRVTRYQVAGAGTLTPTLTNPVTILDLTALSGATNHNGGAIHFGPDGLLYVAVGDNANGANAQSLATLHGKMLRLNPDGTAPSTNPFFVDDSTVTPRDFIWSLGLRNPFTFSFQPGTGRLFINDVGQNTWEEINEGAAGRNFGWATTEGDFSQASFPSFTRPIYAYSHGGGAFQGYAITGGSFYDPVSASFPAGYVGDYFFADYGNSWINVRDGVTGAVTQFATGAQNPVDLEVSSDGALYYLARGTGRIMRITSTATQAPAITTDPDSLTRALHETATLGVTASGTGPLGFRWQQFVGGTWTDLSNGGRISGATTATITITDLQGGDAGPYRAIVTNTAGSATSRVATLTVTSNEAPAATITIDSGLTDGLFHAGEAIVFSGLANDPEDGPLAASQFTWQVDYVTSIASGNPVVRPFVQPFAGAAGGSFTPAVTGPYTRVDVAYRITLVVEDSRGRTTTVTRDVLPAVSMLTVQTSPAGRQFTVDAQPFTTARAFQSVVGFEHPIGVPASQRDNLSSYAFVDWSDGDAATHTVVTPTADTTYTARFTIAPLPNGLTATYFDNANFTGASLTRIDPSINAQWGAGAPAAGFGADTFSVRWTGSVVPLFTEPYTFLTTSDDGVRLWIDNRLVIDNWTLHAPTVNAGRITLVAGERFNVRMEYFENTGGAVARLEWQSASQSRQVIPESRLLPTTQSNGLVATYFNNRDFTGTTASRIDATVNFNWGGGAPHPAIGADTFSVRWTGSIASLSTGSHTFFTTSDDGVRLWVNNRLVIDNWTRHAATVNSGRIDLVAGQRYDIRMEYFEESGSAVARLEWQTPTLPRQVIPTSRLFPTAAPALTAFAAFESSSQPAQRTRRPR